ncbi:hypothetical protein F5X68DRAFT_239036 [Plectosphaerella plurivora]|uniref:Uncharacterized protein n=1 Tax=Plectosphaerella plurivora TaxID=936078 RepID=A0A9P8VLS6_9PEZI|nr:hypothetical protein F5X68DRAFT_239036 [Plectosphaerella plurivora]
MQGALILGLAASCTVSSVAGQPNPDHNALAIAHNSHIHGSDSECGGTYPLPPDTHVTDMPICSQVKAIEERYCALGHPVDDPTALELHRICLCALPFFDLKSKCHKCITAKGDLTPAQDVFFEAVIHKAKEQFCDTTRVNTEPFSKVWLKLVDSAVLEIEDYPTSSEHSEHTAAPDHTADIAAPEHTAAAASLVEANSVCCTSYFTQEEMDNAWRELSEPTGEDDTLDSIALLSEGQSLNMTGVLGKRGPHNMCTRCSGDKCLYCTQRIEEEKTTVDMELSKKKKKRPTDCPKGEYKQCTKASFAGTVVDVRVLHNDTIVSKIYYYDTPQVTTGSSHMTSSSALVLFGCALMGMLATLL